MTTTNIRSAKRGGGRHVAITCADGHEHHRVEAFVLYPMSLYFQKRLAYCKVAEAREQASAADCCGRPMFLQLARFSCLAIDGLIEFARSGTCKQLTDNNNFEELMPIADYTGSLAMIKYLELWKRKQVESTVMLPETLPQSNGN